MGLANKFSCKKLLYAALLAACHVCHSYILLTTNLEDVQNIAKQLVNSPVSGKVKTIIRRVFDVFKGQLVKSKVQEFHDEIEDFRRTHIDKTDNATLIESKSKEASNQNEDFVSLGRNASVYLNKIKKIFEDVIE